MRKRLIIRFLLLAAIGAGLISVLGCRSGANPIKTLLGDRPVELTAGHWSGDRREIAALDSSAEEAGIESEPAARPRPRLGKWRLVTKPGPGCILRAGDPDQGRQRAAREMSCRCRSAS